MRHNYVFYSLTNQQNPDPFSSPVHVTGFPQCNDVKKTPYPIKTVKDPCKTWKLNLNVTSRSTENFTSSSTEREPSC